MNVAPVTQLLAHAEQVGAARQAVTEAIRQDARTAEDHRTGVAGAVEGQASAPHS